MTATHNQGPVIVTGYSSGTGGSNPEAGPSATYQCDSIINPAFPINPGATGLGHVKAFFNHPYPTMVDFVPKVLSNTQICPALAGSAAIAVAAQAFPMQTTTASGRAVAVPVVPFGQTIRASNVVSCMATDPGHTTGTISSGAVSVTSVGDTRMLVPGTYIGIVGAGASANTVLAAKVIARTFNTLTIDTPAASTATTQPIIILDPTGISASPWVNCGAVAEFDVYSAGTRALSVTTAGADVGYIVTISGYDVFLNPMTEAITTVSTTTVNGKKAFKYVSGVTIARGAGGATTANTISVGTTDIVGLNLRSEAWEYNQVYFNGAYLSANTGWVAGLATGTASTATTADVRGTYALQSASDGSKRFAAFQSIPIRQMVAATYADPSSLVGQAQA